MEDNLSNTDNTSTEAKETENKFKQSVKRHKNKIIIGTLAVGVMCVVLFHRNKKTGEGNQKIVSIINNKDKLNNFIGEELPEINKTTDNVPSTIKVSGHIRNLPEGKKPSLEKVSYAQENEIPLKNDQTWVSDYYKQAA